MMNTFLMLCCSIGIFNVKVCKLKYKLKSLYIEKHLELQFLRENYIFFQEPRDFNSKKTIFQFMIATFISEI